MTRPLSAESRAALMKRWARIPERMKAVAHREIDAEAEAMVDEMKRGAPREDGDLQRSIEAKDESDDTAIKARVTAGGALTQRPVRSAGKGGAPFYDYAMANEFGTSEAPAQPFFFPTYRRRRKRFKARLMRELRKAAKEG